VDLGRPHDQLVDPQVGHGLIDPLGAEEVKRMGAENLASGPPYFCEYNIITMKDWQNIRPPSITTALLTVWIRAAASSFLLEY